MRAGLIRPALFVDAKLQYGIISRAFYTGVIMPATLVLGLQWGDEGKGKVVDVLSKNADMVVRFQGGANSGHTVKVGEQTYFLHCIPSGILRERIQCVIGRGMVLEPVSLRDEIEGLREKNIKCEGRLFISPRAHIVLPHHKLLDNAIENSAGKSKIGTTGRGIGPCYSEKAQRTGIQFGELVDPKRLHDRLYASVSLANKILKYVFGVDAPSFEEVYANLSSLSDYFRPFLADTGQIIRAHYEAGDRIIFEGAQAVLLDLDAGTYPYVTSSTTLASGVGSGSGFPPSRLDSVTGIVKAYTTRVGEGPFPSEEYGKTADAIRTSGGEFGTTTGRPRRVGWLDMVALQSAVRSNAVTEIILTKLDILSGLHEIPVCVAYDINGNIYTELPEDPYAMAMVKPIFERHEGWEQDISAAASFSELPTAAQNYVRFIEKTTGVKIPGVSLGKRRDQFVSTT